MVQSGSGETTTDDITQCLRLHVSLMSTSNPNMPSLLLVPPVVIGSALVYLFLLYQRLASRILHTSHAGTLRNCVSNTITSIPKAIYTEEYRSVYDHASRPVPRRLLPGTAPEELFTKLVRRNMSTFVLFPQAWAIWATTPFAQRHTFKASYIDSLDFQEGDIVCGLYRVIVRTSNTVELEFMEPAPVQGRLVINFQEIDATLAFSTGMAMWENRNDKTIMPLERPVARPLHQMTAWWLLDSGVRYLMDLQGN